MTSPSDDRPTEGRFVGTEYRFPVRVQFEDTDLSGVVYHADYLRFMERARSAMLRAVGVDQRARFEAGGGAYAITALAIRYRAPARFEDVLVVTSRLVALRAASVDIQQRVRRGAAILADATVTAALVSATGRPIRQPQACRDAFAGLVGAGSDI